MSWGSYYLASIWAMAGLNLIAGIGNFRTGNWQHGGMFVCYAVACVFIYYQVIHARP